MDRKQEIVIIKRWLKENASAGLIGGYPLGKSYVDSRSDNWWSQSYVLLDKRVSHLLPNLVGKYRTEVEERLKELEKK